MSSKRSEAAALRAELACLRQENEALKTDLCFCRQADLSSWALFATSPDCVFIKDSASRYLLVNPAMERAYGVPAAELLGKSDPDFFSPEAAASARADDLRVLAGEVVEAEHIRRLGGGERVLHIVKAPLRDEGGVVVGICGIARDITAQAETAAALKLSREKYAKTFHASPVWVALSTLDEGRYLEVNDAIARGLKYAPAEMIGHTSRELATWHDPAVRVEVAGRIKAQGFIRNYEVKRRAKDGELLDTIYSGELIAVGGETCLLSVSQDITGLTRAEEALRQSERRFRLLFEEAPLAYQSLDEEGRIIQVNRAWLRALGYRREQVLGQWFGNFLAPASLAVFRDSFPEYKASGRTSGLELEMLALDGSTRWVSYEGLVAREPDGRFRQTHCIFQDITESKRVREALVRSEREYRELFEQAAIGIFRSTLDGRFLRVNPALARMLRYASPAEALAGVRDLGREVYADPGQRAAALAVVSRQGGASVFEGRFRRRDGKERQGRMHLMLKRDPAGAPLWLEGFIEDITAQKQAEDALAKSEEMYRTLVQVAPDAILVWKDARLALINPAGLGLLGHETPEQALGRAMTDLVHPDDLDRALARYRCLEDGEPTVPTAEFRLRTAGGTWRSIEATGARVDYPTPGSVLSVLRDVTEKQAMEHALRESEEKYRRVLETAHEGISMIDADHRVVFANPRLAEMLGREPGELRGQPIARFIHPRELEDHERHMAARRRGLREVFERCMVRPDGGEVWVLVSANPLFAADGSYAGAFAMYTDISDRKLAEAELARSQAALNGILQAAPIGIGLVQGEARALAWSNDCLAAMTGYSREELQGLPARRLYPSEEEYQRVLGAVLPPVQAGEVGTMETRWRRKDGDNFDLLLSVARVNPGDAARGLVLTALDITERKRAEADKAHLEAQLRQAQKMEALGTLAGGVAHDFNNLLAAIMGFSELALEAAQQGEGNSDDLAKIMKAAERARQLVRQILTFSRRVEADRRPLDLNREVRQAVEVLERTLPKMIALEMILAPDLKAIQGDPTQIEQILINLATNGADAMPGGGRLLIETKNARLDEEFCRQHPGVRPGEYVLLCVSDSGQGMDEATRQQIFDPFFTTKGPGRGTGLGLSTVFGLVKAHEGHISCYSQPGQGTTFRIFLPIHGGECPTAAAPKPPDRASLRGSESILLVDDEPALRILGENVLRSGGYRVALAASGEEALEFYRQAPVPPDLVVLDLGMPGMGGLRCLRELKAHDPRVKVVVASGYAPGVQARPSLEAGAAGFVAKPFRLVELLQAVRAALDAK